MRWKEGGEGGIRWEVKGRRKEEEEKVKQLRKRKENERR